MIFTAVILVPTRIEIHAATRNDASDEAREWARQQKPVGEHTAKVLSVQPVEDNKKAP